MNTPEIFAAYYTKAQSLLKKIEHLRNTEQINKIDMMPVLYKLSYITENFITDEELFLRKHNYPNLEIHKKQNRAFINALKNINRDWQSHPRKTLEALSNLFSDWAAEHPDGMDERVKQFMSDNA